MSSLQEQQIASIQAHLEKLERRLQYQEQQDITIPSAHLAITDGSGVAAMSGSTPGSGTVTLKRFDSAGDLATITDALGNAVTKTVYNISATAVGANTNVIILDMATGKSLVIVEDCG